MTYLDHDNAAPIPHEAPCRTCGHAFHRFLACDTDMCDCAPHPGTPGDGSHPLDDTTDVA